MGHVNCCDERWRMMKETDIVIISVDRSDPEMVVVNASVDLLHCPLRLPKATLKSLGYTTFRPQKLKPLIYAVIRRHINRHGGTMPLGGIALDPADIEGLPINPQA